MASASAAGDALRGAGLLAWNLRMRCGSLETHLLPGPQAESI